MSKKDKHNKHDNNDDLDLDLNVEEILSSISSDSDSDSDSEPEEHVDINKIRKGSNIRFLGNKSYSGVVLGEHMYNKIYKVIEISNDRLVIGDGTLIIAAVNMNDCEII